MSGGNAALAGAPGSGGAAGTSAGGAVYLDQSNTTMQVSSGTTLIADGIGGTGNVQKTGPGTLQLGGLNTFSGSSQVDAGTWQLLASGVMDGTSSTTVAANATLWVQGLIGTGSNTIAEGALLAGTGTLQGPTTVAGQLAPGALPLGSIGTLTVADLTLLPSATSSFAVAALDQFSRLRATGSVTVDGTLAILPVGGVTFEIGQSYPLIEAAGSISGSFESVQEVPGLRTRFYAEAGALGSTGWWIIAPKEYTDVPISPGLDPIAEAANSFIPMTQGDREVVSAALDRLSIECYNNAFFEMSPLLYTAVPTLDLNLTNATNLLLLQRLWARHLLAESCCGGMSAEAEQGQSWRSGQVGGFLQGFGVFARANSGGALWDYHGRSGVALAGVTAQPSACSLLGAFLGYQTTSGDLERGNHLHAQGVRYGILGSWERGGLSVQGLLGGVWERFDLERCIRFSTIRRIAQGQSSTRELDAAVQLSYGWQLGSSITGPLANAQFTQWAMSPVQESGACSLNLCLDYPTIQSLLVNLGWQWGGVWSWGTQWSVAPQAYLAWQRQCLNLDSTLQAGFFDCGPFEAFCTPTCSPARNAAVVGAELSFTRACVWNFSLNANAVVGNPDLQSVNLLGSISYRF